MSDSVRPHRQQLTRLPHPWDSPGKNTGVGCHFLLQCMKVKSEREVAQSCPTSQPHGLQPTRLLHPWDLPGKSTGVGRHRLLPSLVLAHTCSGDYSPCRHHLPFHFTAVDGFSILILIILSNLPFYFDMQIQFYNLPSNNW